MGKRTFRVCMSILAVVITGLIWLNIKQETEKQTWDVCYEMTNKRIEWTGAGYSGINRR